MATKAERKAAARAAKLAAAAPQAPATEAPATEAQAPATEKPKIVTKVVGTLKLTTADGSKLRGARDAWYKVLKEHEGKPAQEYLDATTKNPPSLPKSQRQEPSSGWLRWFVRNGYVTIQQEAKP